MPEKAVKFYNLSLEERRKWVAEQAGIPLEDVLVLSGVGGLTAEQADHMIENVIGVFGLPLGIARNFRVNGRDVLVPMVIEEPSVVAGRLVYGPPGAGRRRFHRHRHRAGDDRADADPRPGRPAHRPPGHCSSTAPSCWPRPPPGRPGPGQAGRRGARPGGAPDRPTRPLAPSWCCT